MSSSTNSACTGSAETVAKQLVKNVISLSVSLIETDPHGLFVYLDPFYDDVRPHWKSGDSKKISSKNYKASRESEQPNWEKEDLHVVKSVPESLKTRQSTHSRQAKIITHDSNDSDISMASREYSYFMVDPVVKESRGSDILRRSTFENTVFRTKNKQQNSFTSDDADNLENETLMVGLKIEQLKHMIHEWQSIQDFDIETTVSTIRDFVNLWKLAPAIQFAIAEATPVIHQPLGVTYQVTVMFSKPTPMCPNPLSVANVYFDIHRSSVMPQNYVVMITYRFETYKTNYYLMGKKNMRSITFQNYFIETILNAKLLFYVEMF